MNECKCEKKPSLFWMTIRLIAIGMLLVLFSILFYLKLEDEGVINQVGEILSKAFSLIPYNKYILIAFLLSGLFLVTRRLWIYLQND